MSLCQRCAKRSNRIGKSCLMKRYDIHISLAEKKIRLPGGSCTVQSIQIPALIKDKCLRRIQILGLCIPHDAPSEPDHTAVCIHNRKHDPVPELVIDALSLIYTDQSRLGDQLIFVPLSLKVLIQIIAVLVRVSKAESLDGLLPKSPSGQVCICMRPSSAFKLNVKIPGSLLVNLQQNRFRIRPLLRFLRVFPFRQLYPRTVGKNL